MARYCYFPDSEFPQVSVSTTFDTKNFGELELVGTLMSYKTIQKSFWEMIGTGGSITSEPGFWNGMVFFGSRDFNAYCLDAETGKLAWKFRTGGLVDQVTEYDGKAYFGSWDNIFYCTDSATGRELWRFKANGFITYFSITGDRLYFGSWDCHMYCLDAETGKLIWKFKTSLGTPSQIEPPETGIVTSAQVVWSAPEEEAKKAKQGEAQISDYGAASNEYASSIGRDYLGKKKRGYV